MGVRPNTSVNHFLRSLINALRDSVLVRLGLAMGTLALLSFVSILMSTVIADSSSGKATAVNLSGSLRMMSFRILSEAQQPDKRRQIPGSIEQFERRLHNLERIIEIPRLDQGPLARVNRTVNEHWQSNIRPLALAAADHSPEALSQLAQDVPGFVQHIDQMVQLIEEDLEKQIRLLRATQFALLGVIIVLSLITSWMLRRYLVSPLADLLRAARTVSQGSFTTRVSRVGSDELGQLGQAFNTMIGEIANMYAHLEEKVDEKTRELLRTNQSLELLYRTSQQLSASDLSLETIQAVLHDIERELELGHSMLCISEQGKLPARPILGDLDPEEKARLCGRDDCRRCFQLAEQPVSEQVADPERRIVVVPLIDAERVNGALPIFIKDAGGLPREKVRILETVGHHISNALANMRRAEEKHRLAVLEERSVIARELHDSIAQSLSYLKIQVTRLEKQLDNPADARIIAQELRHGLNSAYRELRELITTFRLRIDERGFTAALEETIEEYSARLGFDITLANTLAGIVLSGNEEMHVIRIIREALTNSEKHAGATAVGIDIAVDSDYRVKIVISDNGRGFDPSQIPPNHYGTTIMRDRTQSLGGDIHIDSRPGAGTRIVLSFQPQKYRVSPT